MGARLSIVDARTPAEINYGTLYSASPAYRRYRWRARLHGQQARLVAG